MLGSVRPRLCAFNMTQGDENGGGNDATLLVSSSDLLDYNEAQRRQQGPLPRMRRMSASMMDDECSSSSCNRETIHSGHFMVSDIDDTEPQDDDEDDDVVSVPVSDGGDDRNEGRKQLLPNSRSGYDFEGTAIKETANTYNFGPRSSKSVSIDATLTKLFRCMTLAYSGKLTSPRWKNFKGLKLRWKDKIRLNNVIWRAWHMQFVQRRRPTVCTFACPVDDSHKKPEAVVLEGKYWKRQIDTVRAEYKSWRVSTQKTPDFGRNGDYGSSDNFNFYDWQPRSNQSAYSCSSMLVDDDTFGEYSDTLFSCLIPSHPFPFPNPREIARAGIADFIQPGLVQFQPNLDDFMDTFDVLSQRLPPVLEEGDAGTFSSILGNTTPAAAAASSSHSVSSQGAQSSSSASGYMSMDLMGPPQAPVQSTSSAPVMSDLRREVNFQSSKAYLPSSGVVNNSIASSLRNSSVSAVPSNRFAATSTSALETPIAMESSGGAEAGKMSNEGVPLVDLQLATSLIKEEEHSRGSSSGLFSLTPPPPPSASNYLFSSPSPPHPHQPSPPIRSPPLSQSLVVHPTHSPPPPPQHLLHSPPPPHHHHPPPTPQNTQQRDANKYLDTLRVRSSSRSQLAYDTVTNKMPDMFHHHSMTSSLPIGMMSNSMTDVASTSTQPSNGTSMNDNTVLRRASIGYDKGVQRPRKEDDVFVVPKPKGRTRSRSGPTLGHLLQQQQQQQSRMSPPVASSNQSTPTPIAPHSSPSAQQQSSIQGCGALLAQLLSTGSYSSVDKVNNRNSSPPAVTILPNATTSQTIVVTPVSWPAITSVNDFQNQVLMGATSQVFSLLPPAGKMVLPSNSTASSSLNSTVITTSVADSMTTSPKAFRPKSDTDRKQYREHRRVCHINAEQKRRCNIKNGFDTLHHLVPCLSHNPNAKVSKAAMLHKAGEYIKQLKVERAQLQEEAELLKKQIESLNQAINMCQSQLPATGAPVPCQRPNKLQKMFEDYVKERVLQNWKFWLFSRLIQPLLESYSNTVSTASVEDLCKTVLTWLEQHCSLVSLRPVVFNSLRHLTATTNILTDPSQIREEAAKNIN